MQDNQQALQHLREEIDRIDSQIIALLGERAKCVEQVGRLKPSMNAIRVVEREKIVLERVQALGREHGLDPDFPAQLYRIIMDYFTGRQEADWLARVGETN